MEQKHPSSSEQKPTSKHGLDWNRLEGNWRQFKGRVRSKWGKLTNDDIEDIAGKKDQLLGKLQERYGRKREELEREVDDWLKKF